MQLKQNLEVPRSETSPEFLQGMVQRMEMSFFKYGKVADAYPNKVQALARFNQLSDEEQGLLRKALGMLGSFGKRILLYFDTGNTEALIDGSNFLMIEYMRPAHPDAHFKTTDSKESPGRVWNSGEESQKSNFGKPRG